MADNFSFYRGDTLSRSAGPDSLPPAAPFRGLHPERYLPGAGLVDAVNVSILLGQPLLLTGEPGTGKTLLADHVAHALGLGEALRFETKSTSTSRDLFYVFNTIGRFHAAQTGTGSQDPRDYITYHALGRAILRTRAPEEAAAFTSDVHDAPRRSVVLIDELDKAPRDFPNDILNEIEQMYFRVPELANLEIRADDGLRPIVIVTSNSERHLPDAFLRRCVYYHIEFPDRDRLEEIALTHLGPQLRGHSQLLDRVLSLFLALRDPQCGLRKRPATAELLGWIFAIRTVLNSGEATEADAGREQIVSAAIKTLGCVAKSPEDRQVARDAIETWRLEQRPGSGEL